MKKPVAESSFLASAGHNRSRIPLPGKERTPFILPIRCGSRWRVRPPWDVHRFRRGCSPRRTAWSRALKLFSDRWPSTTPPRWAIS